MVCIGIGVSFEVVYYAHGFFETTLMWTYDHIVYNPL